MGYRIRMFGKFLKISTLGVLVLLFCGVARYTNYYVSKVVLGKVSIDVNTELNSVFMNSILSKYSGLLNEVPTHVGTNPYHINLAIKLRTEFIHALEGLEDTQVVLYNSGGAVVFTVAGKLGGEEAAYPLSVEQLANLKSGNVLHVSEKKGVYTSLFPLKISRSETPVAFLGVTKNFQDIADIVTSSNIILMAPMALVVIACTVLLVLVYKRNTSLLSKQYDANLELQEKKESAEKESSGKSLFLANVSHELRTPLNSIIGFSEMMINESLGEVGSKYKEYVNDIHSAGVHLLSLINDILDFTKAEDNKLNVELAKCDLVKVVDTCFKMLSTVAQNGKVELRREIQEDQIVILADARRMKQVLLNILSNSVKFTPEDGFVKLFMYVKQSSVVIEVSDSGIGIAQQDLYKVMSVFGQADSTHSRKYEGTGLGLPLSKKLVELMRGTFNIKSEPNLGTVVTLVFPCIAEDSEAEKTF